ncbi:MAG: hypothetical protein ABIU54_00280 [Candidatus Eisenbacteria bacterium]
MTLREYRQLPTPALMKRFEIFLTSGRGNLAELLACMGVIESRQVHVAAGYPSMHAYCVGVFHMSGDEAFKRIRSARAARRFPILLQAVADGRIHLTAITILAKHLTPANVTDLVEASTHRTKLQIRLLIAQRFPLADVPTSRREVSTSCSVLVPTLEPAAPQSSDHAGYLIDVNTSKESQVPEPVGVAVSRRPVVLPIDLHQFVTPLSPTRVELRCTISHEAHDDLRAIQALLGHAAPGIDVVRVVERALREMHARLEKQKFAATECPRASKGVSTGRYIPNQVRREVRDRDGGQCTFVGSKEHRCEARTLLEFDHVRPVSCGGKSTTQNLSLRCHAHNQHEAEQLFGEEFMEGRRAEGRSRSARVNVDTLRPPS